LAGRSGTGWYVFYDREGVNRVVRPVQSRSLVVVFAVPNSQEVAVTREEFVNQVNAVGRSDVLMDTARIVFTDGESHVVQTWTIEEGENGVLYYDVHTSTASPKALVPYRVIARVEKYDGPRR
jgi:hypothetical protein